MRELQTSLILSLPVCWWKLKCSLWGHCTAAPAATEPNGNIIGLYFYWCLVKTDDWFQFVEEKSVVRCWAGEQVSSRESNERVSRDAAGWPHWPPSPSPSQTLLLLYTGLPVFRGFLKGVETTEDERDNHPLGISRHLSQHRPAATAGGVWAAWRWLRPSIAVLNIHLVPWWKSD